MKTPAFAALGFLLLALNSCQTGQTAASGTANTVGHAAQGMGRTARTLGTGAVNTVGNTASTAGSGIAEGDLRKSTVGAAGAAGRGTADTAVKGGRSHLGTSRGVMKDTGKTLSDTAEAAENE